MLGAAAAGDRAMNRLHGRSQGVSSACFDGIARYSRGRNPSPLPTFFAMQRGVHTPCNA